MPTSVSEIDDGTWRGNEISLKFVCFRITRMSVLQDFVIIINTVINYITVCLENTFHGIVKSVLFFHRSILYQ